MAIETERSNLIDEWQSIVPSSAAGDGSKHERLEANLR